MSASSLLRVVLVAAFVLLGLGDTVLAQSHIPGPRGPIGPPGPAGPAGPPTTDASLLSAGTLDVARLPPSAPQVANYAALKELPVPAAAYVGVSVTNRVASSDLGGGVFVWLPGNQASLVAIDTQQCRYVAPSSDTTGGHGVWQRLSLRAVIDATSCGAVADSGVTDNAPILNAAAAFAAARFWPLHIPAGGPDSIAAPTVRKYYGMLSPLLLGPTLDNLTITGDGPGATELRFTNDSDGIRVGDGSTDVLNHVHIARLSLRGVADVSSSTACSAAIAATSNWLTTACTAGMRLASTNHDTFSDIEIQDFTVGRVFDATNSVVNDNLFLRVNTTFAKYPNANTLYPAYGAYYGGGTNKPQVNRDVMSFSYAQISNLRNSWTGDGSTTAFTLDLSSKIPLYKETGIQVLHEDMQAQGLSLVPMAVGTGYVTGDTVTLAGGVCSVQPVATVTATAGAVTAATISAANAGQCSVEPPNPVAQASTSGTGSGATFVVSWQERPHWVKYAIGTDYNLFSTDDGSGSCPGANHDAIAPGTTYVKKKCIRVEFATPPVAGTNGRCNWIDPTGIADIYVAKGNANVWDGGLYAGYTTLFDLQDAGNRAEIDYAQIAHTVFNIGPSADLSITRAAYWQDGSTLDGLYATDAQSANPSTGFGNARAPVIAYTSADQSFTSGQHNIVWSNTSSTGRLDRTLTWLQYRANLPGPRLVEAEIPLSISGTAGTATGTILMQVSYDGGATTSNLAVNRPFALTVGAGAVAAQQTVRMTVRDDQSVFATSGVPAYVWYRAQVSVTSANTTVTVGGASSARSRLLVTTVNPE